MSYDYMLVKGKPGGGLEALAESAMSQTAGAVAEVKAAISRLFPSVRWETGPEVPRSTSASFWFGAGRPQFQLVVNPNGQVLMINMSHCERSEVERVARDLDLVAVDEQSLEDF